MDPKTIDLSTLHPEAIYNWAREATPPEIDLLQSRLSGEWAQHWAKRERASDYMTRFKDDAKRREHYAAERAEADGKCQWYDTLRSECEYEYIARERWTRYFLVRGANGHVHSTTTCQTCNRNYQRTDFAWLTQYSGMPQEEFVQLAGERACTVCFPDAPVEKRSMLDDDVAERARLQKVREDREAKKRERRRKAIALRDGEPVELKLTNGQRAKTRISADRAAVDAWCAYRGHVDRAKKATAEDFKQWQERLAGEELSSFNEVIEAYGLLGESRNWHHERLSTKAQARYDKRGY